MSDTATRKKMLVGLSDDLFAAGWDQPCKMWMVMGEPDDEWLEYVGSYENMGPEHWFMHRAEEGVLKDHIRGIATCYEAWTYPPELRERLADNKVSEAYKFLVPQDEHPDRGSVRTIIITMRDGAVLRADRDSVTDETVTQEMEGVPPTGLTGERLVDYMRSMLGTAEINTNPLHGLQIILAQGDTMKDILTHAAEEGWSQAQVSAAIYQAAPEEMQADLIQTMPDDVRKVLGLDDDAQD